jgi:cytochrome o ubiquinol oxidase subunit 2
MNKIKTFIIAIAAVMSSTLLSGCKDLVLIHSAGKIGKDEMDLIYTALGLMLLVVIPVIILTLVFAFKYRSTNTNAKYDPDFHHSTKIEIVIWGVPIIIIGILGAIIWDTTHKLDPYRPLDMPGVKPLTVEVVALDWKWLFIYPEQHIATVNYLQLPVGVPVNFKITADAPMNSFMIPQLGGQIYAMAGMQTQLHLIADREGVYDGRGYAFSGAGFNGMHFKTHVGSQDDFDAWVNQVKSSSSGLDVEGYKQLALPSEYVAPQYFGSVSDNLFENVIMKFMMPGMEDMQGVGAK